MRGSSLSKLNDWFYLWVCFVFIFLLGGFILKLNCGSSEKVESNSLLSVLSVSWLWVQPRLRSCLGDSVSGVSIQSERQSEVFMRLLFFLVVKNSSLLSTLWNGCLKACWLKRSVSWFMFSL